LPWRQSSHHGDLDQMRKPAFAVEQQQQV